MRPLLQKCLEKDPKNRLRDIADAWLLLADKPAESASVSSTPVSRFGRWTGIAAGVMTVIAGALAFIHFREKPPAAPDLMRFQIELPDKVAPIRSGLLSPDGRKIVFPATGADGETHLYLRSLDSLDTRVLPIGEEFLGRRPFWSPDSHFVAFEAGGKLKNIDVTGGPPQTLCDISGALLGGSWNRDGIIIFGTTSDGVMRVSAAGSVASPVTARRNEWTEGFPSFLPDGRHFVYHGTSAASGGPSGVYIGSVDATPEQQNLKQLVASPVAPVYAAASNPDAGTLLFLREQALMAQPFDVRHLQLTGEPVVIADGLGVYNSDGFFSASENGAFLYRGGEGGGSSALTWFDRQGKSLSSGPEPIGVGSMRLSPDAGRVALGSLNPRDIWLFDFSRGTNTRLTFGSEANPAWSPDGSRIAFNAVRANGTGIYQKESSGAGGEELLIQGSTGLTLTDWSSDGHFLL